MKLIGPRCHVLSLSLLAGSLSGILAGAASAVSPRDLAPTLARRFFAFPTYRPPGAAAATAATTPAPSSFSPVSRSAVTGGQQLMAAAAANYKARTEAAAATTPPPAAAAAPEGTPKATPAPPGSTTNGTTQLAPPVEVVAPAQASAGPPAVAPRPAAVVQTTNIAPAPFQEGQAAGQQPASGRPAQSAVGSEIKTLEGSAQQQQQQTGGTVQSQVTTPLVRAAQDRPLTRRAELQHLVGLPTRASEAGVVVEEDSVMEGVNRLAAVRHVQAVMSHLESGAVSVKCATLSLLVAMSFSIIL